RSVLVTDPPVSPGYQYTSALRHNYSSRLIKTFCLYSKQENARIDAATPKVTKNSVPMRPHGAKGDCFWKIYRTLPMRSPDGIVHGVRTKKKTIRSIS